MFHKPRGTVCEEQAAERSIFRCLKAEQQHPNLQFFGRLDRDTSGLLLLGTDGGLGHLLTSPDSGAEAALREAAARGGSGARAQIPSPTLSSGAVPSDEAGLLPGSLDQIVYPRVDASELPCVRLVLHEGKFHQVKRMLAACDGYVIGLHREAVGPLKLGKLNIPVGTARAPSSAEMLAILSMLNSSCRVATARKACVATRRREAAS
ncbi:pseudouridine synthase [Pavlovales sp. CCMP2436]|nr:pseudouridine synthase [Pavlovales sp. CCMP2436]